MAWRPRVTAIPVICTEGLLDVGTYYGHVSGETFLHFVNYTLAPWLLPFDGFNPRSVVILGITFTLNTRTAYILMKYLIILWLNLVFSCLFQM